nr:hypothetical protein [uncultured Desulfobulbus sp.]
MKQKIQIESEMDILKSYPLKSNVQGWYFRISEIANNAYQVEGTDRFGRIVSRQGDNPDELIQSCEEYAKELISHE